jgi:hypothetical protein
VAIRTAAFPLPAVARSGFAESCRGQDEPGWPASPRPGGPSAGLPGARPEVPVRTGVPGRGLSDPDGARGGPADWPPGCLLSAPGCPSDSPGRRSFVRRWVPAVRPERGAARPPSAPPSALVRRSQRGVHHLMRPRTDPSRIVSTPAVPTIAVPKIASGDRVRRSLCRISRQGTCARPAWPRLCPDSPVCQADVTERHHIPHSMGPADRCCISSRASRCSS